MKTLPSWCQSIRVAYTEQGHTFYGAYLHDAPETANRQWQEKLRYVVDFEELVDGLGILDNPTLGYYDEQVLGFIADRMKRLGITMVYGANFDVS